MTQSCDPVRGLLTCRDPVGRETESVLQERGATRLKPTQELACVDIVRRR